MARSIYLLFLLLISISAYGQKEDYNWYFGATGAGLNFDSCRVTTLTNGVLSSATFEGTTAISDEQTGQLLFYTNGLNVYSHNHTLMQNGYQAALSTSITQNIIVKKPGSTSTFYLFTADVQGGISSNPAFPTAIGINWAEIDMSLNGGLGSVVSKFNILKDTSNCEKLTAVRHANGQDIWLVGHEYGNNNFFVYQITSAGIDTIPQFFSLGPTIITPQQGIPAQSRYDAIGEMKASPDGSRIAFTSYYNGYTAVFDFDNTSGAITQPIELKITGGGYGLTFSPDNNLLYLGRIDTNTTGGLPSTADLLQFDLRSGDSATIQNSVQSIYSCVNCGFSSMKIAPNRKIIVSHYGTSGSFTGDPFLGVISKPDSIGIYATYAHFGISLNGQPSSWGLNNLMENPNYCLTTDIEEFTALAAPFIVSPNPFTDVLHISGEIKEPVEITLRNTLSQTLRKTSMRNSSSGTLLLDGLSELPAGLYLIALQTPTHRYLMKAIKR